MLKNHYLAIALNFEQAEGSLVPTWVQLLPAPDKKTKKITGIDGRAWVNDKPEDIIQHFLARQAQGRDLVFDYEHGTEHKALNGELSVASGWGKQMKVEADGSIWAQSDWTEKAKNHIKNKEIRYLSPVLLYDPKTLRIKGIDSVALTNQGNFSKALNHEQSSDKQETTMDKTILAALGLADDATAEDVVKAINALKAKHQKALNHAQTPSIEKFVPRDDFDAQTLKANNAEQKLSDYENTAKSTEITTLVDKAVADKKITPATADYHKAACAQEGGLDAFKKMIGGAPEIMGDTDLGGKGAGEHKALNAEQKEMAAVFGNTEEDLKAFA